MIPLVQPPHPDRGFANNISDARESHYLSFRGRKMELQMCFKAILVVALLIICPTSALADEASAWKKYEHRVDGILAAIHEGWQEGTVSEGRRQRVKSLCKGVTRDSTGGEGPMLPAWARSLITACGYVDEMVGLNMDSIWSANDVSANCKQMKEDAAAMLKAKPVAAAPAAHEKTLHLGADLRFFHDGGCKRKRDARSPYHPS